MSSSLPFPSTQEREKQHANDHAHANYVVGRQRDWVWRGWQTRYVVQPSDDGSIAVPMLLLHGFGASIAHWRHNIPAFSQHYPVYALDLVGFGASEKASTTYNTDIWVEQVYEFWRTFIGQPVVLVGNSIGSLVCMAAAAAHPEMVCGIAMLNLPDSSVIDDLLPATIRPIASAMGRVLQPLTALAQGIFTQPLWFNPLFRIIRRPSVIRAWAKQAYVDRHRVTDDLVAILSRPAYDHNADRALRAMVNSPSGTFTAKAALPHLQVPMLLIWGKQDQMVPPTLAPLFAKLNPAMTVVQLDQAGHCPHDETPERVNPLILDWIKHRIEG